MLIVDDLEFERHLLNEQNKENNAKIIPIEHGRGLGNVNTPMSIRKIVSDAALEGDSAKEIAKVLPISESSIAAYKNSATSTTNYHDPHPELQSHTKTTKNRISESATQRLEEALAGITQEKIAGAKLRDIASVARDMSQIVRNMEDGHDENKGNVNITFYAPHLRKEETFDVIDVE